MPPYIRKSTAATGSALLACLLFATCSKVGVNIGKSDVYLDCRGSVSVLLSDVRVENKEQSLAVHIAGNKISFSGNMYLASDSIPLCDRGNDKDEFYFETSACEWTPNTVEHIFGKLNKITGVLSVSYDSKEGGTKRSNVGDFVCHKVNPISN